MGSDFAGRCVNCHAQARRVTGGTFEITHVRGCPEFGRTTVADPLPTPGPLVRTTNWSTVERHMLRLMGVDPDAVTSFDEI